MTTPNFTVTLERLSGMQFKTTFDFDHFPELMFDEPENVPTGKNEYPNASRILAAAVGNCLSASLTFCLEKRKVPLDNLTTVVKGTLGRSEEGYWRIQKLDVEMHIKYDELTESVEKSFERCKNLFFNYCIVSASIKEGIEINVNPILDKK